MPEEPRAESRRLLRDAGRPRSAALVEASTARRATGASRALLLRVELARRRLGQGAGAARRARALPQVGQAVLRAPRVRRQQGVLPRHRLREDLARRPRRILDVSGLAAEVTFFKGTLDKLGVEAQFEGVGQVQERPEPVHGDGLHRAAPRADGRARRQPLRPVRGGRSPQSRGLERRTRCGRSSTAGPFRRAEAKQAGLVDELLYRGRARGAACPGRRPAGAAPLRAARARLRLRPPAEARARLRGGRHDARARARRARSAARRGLRHDHPGPARRRARTPSVRAIVLRVDSPGGSGTASDVIWREVQLARQAKPVSSRWATTRRRAATTSRWARDAIVAAAGHDHGLDRRLRGQVQPARALRQARHQQGDGAAAAGTPTLFSSYEPWTDEERAKVRDAEPSPSTTTSSARRPRGARRRRPRSTRVAQGRVWTGRRGPRGAASSTRSAASTPPCAWRASGPASRRARTCSSWSCRSARASSRRSWSARRRTCCVRALGREAASLLRWGAGARRTAGPIARLPFELWRSASFRAAAAGAPPPAACSAAKSRP